MHRLHMSYYPIHQQFLPPSPFRQTLVSVGKTDKESTLPFTLSALLSSHYNDWTSMSKPHTSAFTVKCIPVHRGQLSSTGQSSSAPLVSPAQLHWSVVLHTLSHVHWYLTPCHSIHTSLRITLQLETEKRAAVSCWFQFTLVHFSFFLERHRKLVSTTSSYYLEW